MNDVQKCVNYFEISVMMHSDKKYANMDIHKNKVINYWGVLQWNHLNILITY